MRALAGCLSLVCALLLFPPARAAEVQPTAADWKRLLSHAAETQREYQMLSEQTKQALAVRKSGAHMASPEPRRPAAPSVASLEELQRRCGAADTEATALVAELRSLKAPGRTRARFLQLRRRAKELRYRYTQDCPRMYDTDPATREQIDTQQQEALVRRLVQEKWEAFPPAPLPKGLQMGWREFPRMDGSTTAQPLATLIACRLLGLGAEWHSRWVSNLRNADATRERVLVPVCAEPPLLAAEEFPGLLVSVRHSGTHTAYRNLILGASSFILVARPPSPDELALAKSRGVELDIRCIATDAFIFLLNEKNPVTGLTVSQIREIYQDNVLRWSEVGGNNDEVIAFQRERNSGSQETMESLVMKGLKMAPPDQMAIGYGMGGPYDRLRGSRNGIAYTFYYYHTFQSPDHPNFHQAEEHTGREVRKVCAVNGVLPTSETIANRTYPFVTEVYAVVRKDAPTDSSAVRLRDWLSTPEGQAVVAESGYVPAATR